MTKHANNEFIGESERFDDLIAQLKSLRARHFGVVLSDDQRTWKEVAMVADANDLIFEAIERISGAAK